MMKKKKYKKKRLAFKRSHDFWAGVTVSSFISTISFILLFDMSLLLKTLLFAFLFIKFLFLIYLDKSSNIIRLSLKELIFWKKKKNINIDNHSLAIDHGTLLDMVENKKKLEEALKMLEKVEADKKVTEFIKNMNHKNNNTIWKN